MHCYIWEIQIWLSELHKALGFCVRSFLFSFSLGFVGGFGVFLFVWLVFIFIFIVISSCRFHHDIITSLKERGLVHSKTLPRLPLVDQR